MYRLLSTVEWSINVVLMAIAYFMRADGRMPDKRKRTVCLFRYDSIGDFVLFTASLRDYRTHFGDSRVILIVNEVVERLARGCPYVDEVWVLTRSSFRRDLRERWRWMVRLAGAGIDIAVNAVYSTDLAQFECLVGWSWAGVRIAHGYNADRVGGRRAWPFYTELAQCSGEKKHELERNADLLRFLGMSSQPNMNTEIWLTAQDEMAAALALEPLLGSPFIVVVPGSQMNFKRWPAGLFGELIRSVADRTNVAVVLCGDDSEKSLCESIAAMAHQGSPLPLVLAGRTDLGGLGGVIMRAEVVVGNDTATLHMAAALGIPVVCILGGGHYGRFFPYPDNARIKVVTNSLPCFQCDWKCIFDEMRCITGVTATFVADEVVGFLQRRSDLQQRDRVAP